MRKVIFSFILSLCLPLSVMAFSDVPEDHEYYWSIAWALDEGIVEGYEDGTFKPDDLVNRAEFLKMLFEFREQEMLDSEVDFSDVEKEDWYYKYVQTALNKNLVKGYEDGSFKPDNPINFVEMAKVLIKDEKKWDQIWYSKYSPKPWYADYIQLFEKEKLILPSISGFDHKLSRGEIVEIFQRLAYDLNKETQTYVDLYEKLGNEIEVLENPSVPEESYGLAYNDKWIENSKVSFSFDEYPLPWKYMRSVDGNSFVLLDANGESLERLLELDKFAEDSIFYVSDRQFDSNIGDFVNRSSEFFEPYEDLVEFADFKPDRPFEYISAQIRLNGDWLTIPYEGRWVSAINLKTGDYVSVALPRFYSDIVFNGSEFVYFEHNQEGCVSNLDLIYIEGRAFEKDASCYLKVFSIDDEQEKTIGIKSDLERSGFYAFTLEKKIYHVDRDYIWIQEAEDLAGPVGVRYNILKYSLDNLDFVGGIKDYLDMDNTTVGMIDENYREYKIDKMDLNNSESEEWLSLIGKKPEFIDFMPVSVLYDEYERLPVFLESEDLFVRVR